MNVRIYRKEASARRLASSACSLANAWRSIPLLLEYPFRDQCVDAFDAVDGLGHHQVHRGTEQHVGVFTRKTFRLDNEIEHLACRDFGGLIYIFIESHRHIVRRRFCTVLPSE